VRIEQDEAGVTIYTTNAANGSAREPILGRIAVGCDGFHSAVRRQLYPDEGPMAYGGINMWRGVTRWKPFLTGASMVLTGALRTGKMVVYPIREPDAEGSQLINWVAEIEQPTYAPNDWNSRGKLEDFFDLFKDWRFPWLDQAGLLRNAEIVLEYPMVDRDPLDRWSFGRITLLGDAAHPMYPRGSNGAGQAILDARVLAHALKSHGEPAAALRAYDAERAPATAKVVLANRRNPPDAILREVDRRTNGQPFTRVEDVISPEEMAAMSEQYKQIAGFGKGQLRPRD
jgi:2-polyprenyl-6-methoxyphenol hydroxylase-like FAD-dependent oxidoreductase